MDEPEISPSSRASSARSAPVSGPVTGPGRLAMVSPWQRRAGALDGVVGTVQVLAGPHGLGTAAPDALVHVPVVRDRPRAVGQPGLARLSRGHRLVPADGHPVPEDPP